MPDEKVFTENNSIMDKSFVPEVIYDENPELVDLYYTAWQSAWEHIFTCPGAPVQTYMNEGIRCHKIWIWDTCFMVQFCRYAADKFPGIQSLDNFYRVIHDGEAMVLKVHHTDNPPLFAWTEYEYLKHTGDLERVKRILLKDQYLQRHYEWMEKLKGGILFDYSTAKTAAEWVPGKGFRWAGCPSGMDNTPRGDDDYTSIYWLELSAQQGLSALYIARLAELTGASELAKIWKAKYRELKETVNAYYWDEADGFYYDIEAQTGKFVKVMTPASYWVMLAEMAPPERAARMADKLTDPQKLGGMVPCVTLARDDADFNAGHGLYWRGAMWVPTAYMTIKALEKYGMTRLASELSGKILHHMSETYRNYEPHTIWECYAPNSFEPARSCVPSRRVVRKDFCGWSALAPISLYLENIIGLRETDAFARRVVWELPGRVIGKLGVRNYQFGEITASLMFENGHVTVESDADFVLEINGHDCAVRTGNNSFDLK